MSARQLVPENVRAVLGRDRGGVSGAGDVLPLWEDPTVAEVEIRRALQIQVLANQKLRVELSETEAKLREAQIFRTQNMAANELAAAKDPAKLTELQLQEQVRLRDSIITCLQQEVAMLKSQPVRREEETEPAEADLLRSHLQRAKARSQAIADQFVTMYAEERRAMHLSHHSAPLQAPKDPKKLHLLSP